MLRQPLLGAGGPKSASMVRQRAVAMAVAALAAAMVVFLVGANRGSTSVLESDMPIPMSQMVRQMDKSPEQPKVHDTTGHWLSREAIKGNGLSANGGMSDGQLAVLESAGRLQHRSRETLEERLNRKVENAFARGKEEQKEKVQNAKDEFDKLNKGYAQQMQAYLTGSKRVGNVVKAIDSHDATYLKNTGLYGKQISARTEMKILHTAEKQRAHEKKGLVHMDGLMHRRSRHPKTGVVHTSDGFVLEPALRQKGRTTTLAEEEEHDPRLDSVDGCICAGSSDEDKGPKCSCLGDPEFASVDHEFSPEEVTMWGEAAAPSWHPGPMPSGMKGNKVQLKQAKLLGIKPTPDSINTFLQDMLVKVAKKDGGNDRFERLRTTVESVQDAVSRDPQARDLITKRLNKLKASMIASAGQKLTDVTNVYIPPYVDDLDDYLQGVLSEVERVEIPDLDAEEEKSVPQALRGKGQKLRAVEVVKAVTVTPDVEDIKNMLSDLAKAYKKKAKGPQAKIVKLDKTVSTLKSVVEKIPASRDMVAERLTDFLRATTPKGQKLTDVTNVYIPPYVDDLDDYLQGILSDVERVEIPDLDAEEEKGRPLTLKQARRQSLLPIEPTRNIYDKSRAKTRGDWLDNMEWQKYPFETRPEEADNLAKVTGDKYATMDKTMVHGADSLRTDPPGEGVRNPYGWLGSRKDAPPGEVPVESANGLDTEGSVGVQTSKSLLKSGVLCKTVNCYNEDAIPLPPAARMVRRQALEEEAEEKDDESKEDEESKDKEEDEEKGDEDKDEDKAEDRKVLGDEVFDMGVNNHYNDGDVIYPADDPNVSSAYFSARKARTHQK